MDLHGNIIRIRYFHKVMKHVVFQNAVGPFGVSVKSLWRAACILHQTLEIPLCISHTHFAEQRSPCRRGDNQRTNGDRAQTNAGI